MRLKATVEEGAERRLQHIKSGVIFINNPVSHHSQWTSTNFSIEMKILSTVSPFDKTRVLCTKRQFLVIGYRITLMCLCIHHPTFDFPCLLDAITSRARGLISACRAQDLPVAHLCS
jgi:hypothetical protein